MGGGGAAPAGWWWFVTWAPVLINMDFALPKKSEPKK